MVLAAMKWKYWQYLLILLGVGFYFADESMWRLAVVVVFAALYIMTNAIRYFYGLLEEYKRDWKLHKEEFDETLEKYKRHIDAMRAP
jgi:hypothetical protein